MQEIPFAFHHTAAARHENLHRAPLPIESKDRRNPVCKRRADTVVETGIRFDPREGATTALFRPASILCASRGHVPAACRELICVVALDRALRSNSRILWQRVKKCILSPALS